MTCLPAALNVALDLGFIALARSRLHRTFRERAARSLGPASPAAVLPMPMIKTRQT
jgi:hypothetical protein